METFKSIFSGFHIQAFTNNHPRAATSSQSHNLQEVLALRGSLKGSGFFLEAHAKQTSDM